MSARFYYVKQTGESGGPVDASQLQAFRQAGLLKDDMVCREGDQRWFKYAEELLADNPRPAIARPAAPKAEEPLKVVISGLNIPFGDMVAFMIKWAFASIPAAIVLFGVGLAISFVGMLVLAALGMSVRH